MNLWSRESRCLRDVGGRCCRNPVSWAGVVAPGGAENTFYFCTQHKKIAEQTLFWKGNYFETFMSRNHAGHPHGDQVLKVHRTEIRALGFLPRDIEVLGAVEPGRLNSMSDWVPEKAEYLYLHVKGAICFDRQEGSPLCIEKLFDFYDRYRSLKTDWVQKLERDLSIYQGG